MAETNPNTNTTPARNTVSSSSVEKENPYSLHPSDSPGMNLVNSVFEGRGFPGWRRSILIALSAKKKLGFINGSCKAPALDAKEYEQWSYCNDMVISWILNSLSKDIGDSVIYSKTAKELWDSLEQRFDRSNGAKLFHLQKEISGLLQGNNDIAGYFMKLKRLWDELESLNLSSCCTCECSCQGKEKLVKSLEDQKLIQFLMGLNEAYAQARGTILMMCPLPSMDQAYSLLLQDENQREAHVNASLPTDAASFLASGQMRSNLRNAGQANRGGHLPARLGRAFQRNKPRKTKYNPNVSCTHCGKTGHVIDDCYRIIGFPEDFEFTKAKNQQLSVKANAGIHLT